MKGIAKLIEGIVKYNILEKKKTLFQLKLSGKHPDPLSLIFSCMDSRVVSSKYTSSDLGDNYIVKNAGNFVPYPDDLKSVANATSAAGALELTCIRNNMRHVIVTGHSDCKAMHLLYSLRDKMDQESYSSPLELWIRKHGYRTIQKFNYLQKENNFVGPVPYIQESEDKKFHVHIDPDNQYQIEDKLSQVNAVQQVENIAAYPFLKERLANNDLHLHALWYDIYSGNVFMLSRAQQKFVVVDEESYFPIMEEIRSQGAV